MKNIVFSGGGILGISYIGAVKVLEDKKMLAAIDNIAGASAGSVFGLLLALGYSSDEMKTLIEQTNFSDFMDSPYLNVSGMLNGDISSFTSLASLPMSMMSFFNTEGLCRGNFFKTWIRNVILSKGFNPDITFKEFYSKTKKNLVIINTDITKGNSIVRNVINSPDMPIFLAVRASASVPFFFDPIHYENQVLVDGGVSNNYPVDVFEDKQNTLGLFLGSIELTHQVTNIFNFTTSFLDTALRTSVNIDFKSKVVDYNTVVIKTLGISYLDFNITKNQISSLISSGRKAMVNYLEKENGK